MGYILPHRCNPETTATTMNTSGRAENFQTVQKKVAKKLDLLGGQVDGRGGVVRIKQNLIITLFGIEFRSCIYRSTKCKTAS